MSGDTEPRVPPWLPGRAGASPGDAGPHPDITTAAAGSTGQRNWWDDLPDPWDRTAQQAGPSTAHQPGPGTAHQAGPGTAHQAAGAEQMALSPSAPSAGGRSQTRHRAPAPKRRMALLSAVIVVVLIGSATAVRLMAGSAVQSLPPPTPPERVVTGPPAIDPTASPELGPSGRTAFAAPPVPAAAPGPTPPPATAAPATTPPATSPPATIESYEAEAATLVGLAQPYEDPAASGGEAVTGIGTWRLSYVEFDGVVAPAAGEYELNFHYFATSDRRGEFRINNGPYVAVDFPRQGGDSPGVVSVIVELIAGSNRIWFGAAGRRGPDLDRITIGG